MNLSLAKIVFYKTSILKLGHALEADLDVMKDTFNAGVGLIF